MEKTRLFPVLAAAVLLMSGCGGAGEETFTEADIESSISETAEKHPDEAAESNAS